MGAWDEIEPAPPAESPAPIAEQPTAEVEGETSPTVETAKEVESPAVESEAPETPEAETVEEKMIDEDVPIDQIDTVFADAPKPWKAYTKRQTRRLEEAKAAIEFESKFMSATPADALLDDLEAKSPSRYSDLGNAYWNAHKEHFIKQEFDMTREEIFALKEPKTEPKREVAPQTDIDPDEFEYLSEPVKARLAKLDELEAKYPQLEGEVSKLKTAQAEAVKAETQRQETLKQEKAVGLFNTFATQVTDYAGEYIADNIGLKALPDDSDEVKEYISAVTKTLTDRSKLFGEFENRPAYKDDGDAIELAINRLDEKLVNSYVSKARVAAEQILDELAKPYVSALKRMRSPAKQETKLRPEITGTTSSFAPSTNLPKGKGVDAIWEAQV